MHSTCGPQHGFDMPIDEPTALDTNVAGAEAIPPCRYDLRNLPRVDYSGMEANRAHKHAFWMGIFFVLQTLNLQVAKGM